MNTVKISCKKSLLEMMHSHGREYVYRGEENSEWILSSSLERILGENWSLSSVTKTEEYAISLFKNKFALYSKGDQTPESILGWLAIMQHYGCPTRLIDFTESIYTALYFAISGAQFDNKNNFSIYAINYRNIHKDTILHLKNIHSKDFFDIREIEKQPDLFFEKYIYNKGHDVLWITEPFISNLRLDRQSGVFLVSASNQTKIIDLVNKQYKYSENFVKYEICANLREFAYSILVKSGVNSKGIFGDLGGLAHSIAMDIKYYNTIVTGLKN